MEVCRRSMSKPNAHSLVLLSFWEPVWLEDHADLSHMSSGHHQLQQCYEDHYSLLAETFASDFVVHTVDTREHLLSIIYACHLDKMETILKAIPPSETDGNDYIWIINLFLRKNHWLIKWSTYPLLL